MDLIPAQKAELRSRLRKERRTLDREVLAAESAALCKNLLALPELNEAKTVFCYVSCGGEVQTHELIETLLAQGKTVAVPRCRTGGLMDCVPIVSLEELSPAAMGILEPTDDTPTIPWAQIDFAVVPAVACSEKGERLGQGGGYYDRFLEKTGCPFAAVCLEQFLLPSLPCEAHDQFMKIIVTQQRVLRFEDV